MRRVTLTVALAALAAGAAQTALADTADGLPLSRKVNYADLDLTHPAGAETLYRRLISAAHIVCKPLEGPGLESDSRFKACVGQSLATAVTDVNSPLLTSYYQSKTGVPQQRVAQLVK